MQMKTATEASTSADNRILENFLSTLEGIYDKAKVADGMADASLTRFFGSEPPSEKDDAGPRPVPNGILDRFNESLGDIDRKMTDLLSKMDRLATVL